MARIADRLKMIFFALMTLTITGLQVTDACAGIVVHTETSDGTGIQDIYVEIKRLSDGALLHTGRTDDIGETLYSSTTWGEDYLITIFPDNAPYGWIGMNFLQTTATIYDDIIGWRHVYFILNGFAVTGQVTDDVGTPLNDVTFNAPYIQPNSFTDVDTDINGFYKHFYDSSTGTFTVTPAAPGYTFSPAQLTNQFNTDLVHNFAADPTSPPVVTVTQPTTGFLWSLDNVNYINWAVTNLGSATILEQWIEFHNPDNCSSPLVYGPLNPSVRSAGLTSFGVSGYPVYVKVIVTLNGGTQVSGQSGNFIVEPSISLTSPVGGETLHSGATHTITWNESPSGGAGCLYNGLQSHELSYTADNGVTWNVIATVPGTQSSYNWTVPPVNSQQCRVRTNSYYEFGQYVIRESGANFSITPSVVVTYPNGGEKLSPGFTYTVAWNLLSPAGVQSLELAYTSDDGATWNVITTLPGTQTSYVWDTPLVYSNDCRVRITADYGGGITSSDESDANFRLNIGMWDETPVVLKSLDVYGISWPDFNNDGNLDLCITGQVSGLGRIKLFEGDGAGGFVEHLAFFPGNVDVRSAAWGDYNNDGWVDVYVGIHGGANQLYKNEGTESVPGTWLFNLVTAGVEHIGNARGVSWGDYNNDGRIDLYVANYNGSNRLFRNAGAGVFVDKTNEALVGGYPSENSSAGVWGDYDGDGDLDLFIANFQSADRLYRNDGGVFTDRAAASGIPTSPYQSRSAEWIDYDNDGDFDLWVAQYLGVNQLFRNDGPIGGGDIGFTLVTNGPTGVSTDETYMGTWGDRENDADLDLYVANANYQFPTGLNRRYRVDFPGPVFVETGTWQGVGDELSRCAQYGDYDNDGDLDLFLADTENGSPANFLLANYVNYPDRHWLEIDLNGDRSNKSGIGAVIRLTPINGGITQTHHISGGSGYLSQPPLVAHFGWPVETEVDVQVRWPSGVVQNRHYAVVDRRVTITEPPPPTGGGCPFVYVFDGNDFVEDNTILTLVGDHEAGSVDANVTDAYVLQVPPKAVGGGYRLEIREFENEHSYIDRVELVAVDHAGDAEVTLINGDVIVTHEDWILPNSATTTSGIDVLGDIANRDGVMFDGKKGDVVDLSYHVPRGTDLSFATLTDEKENELPPDPSTAILSGVEVLVRESEDVPFERVGVISPRENLSRHTLNLGRALSEAGLNDGGDFQMRLVWHSDHSMDFAGLVSPSESAAITSTLTMRNVSHSRGSVLTGTMDEADGRFVELEPGEQLSLTFDELDLAPSQRRTFVLKATGHYVRVAGERQTPSTVKLRPNTPNPFNPTTTISFDLPVDDDVTLIVYSVDGAHIRTLVQRTMPAGRHDVVWNGLDDRGTQVSSGVYFYTLQAAGERITRKMVMVK